MRKLFLLLGVLLSIPIQLSAAKEDVPLTGGTGSIGKELLRAGTHGLASGLASAMDGGSFGSFASRFISGGASAMFMSGAMKGLTPDDLTDFQRTSLAFKDIAIVKRHNPCQFPKKTLTLHHP